MLGITGAAILGGFGLEYLSVPCARVLQVPRLRREMERGRQLVLTYDDGPGKELTSEILAALSAAGATAVFFSLGLRAIELPEVMDRIVTEGHQVGWHSNGHFHPWRTLPWRAAADCDAGFRALCKWLPQRPLFRPPYGKMTASTLLTVYRHGGRVLWWTEDSGDTHPVPPSPQAVADRLARAGGGVLLMHDFDRRSGRSGYVMKVTDAVLKMAAKEGIECCQPA